MPVGYIKKLGFVGVGTSGEDVFAIDLIELPEIEQTRLLGCPQQVVLLENVVLVGKRNFFPGVQIIPSYETAGSI